MTSSQRLWTQVRWPRSRSASPTRPPSLCQMSRCVFSRMGVMSSDEGISFLAARCPSIVTSPQTHHPWEIQLTCCCRGVWTPYPPGFSQGLALLTLSWDKNWDSHSPMNGYPSFYPRIALVAPSPGGYLCPIFSFLPPLLFFHYFLFFIKSPSTPIPLTPGPQAFPTWQGWVITSHRFTWM